MKKTVLLFTTFFSFIILLWGNALYAQQKKDITTTPQWVKMMDDENVNFFEAQKEFNNYWKNKEKPVEEKEIFDRFEKTKSAKVKLNTIGSDAVKYSFEYKKFLNWQRTVAPYVQPDGHILNAEEQIKLWEQEKKNREDAEKKNGGNTGNKQ